MLLSTSCGCRGDETSPLQFLKENCHILQHALLHKKGAPIGAPACAYQQQPQLLSQQQLLLLETPLLPQPQNRISRMMIQHQLPPQKPLLYIKNTSKNFLRLSRSFQDIPQDKNCAAVLKKDQSLISTALWMVIRSGATLQSQARSCTPALAASRRACPKTGSVLSLG